MPLRPAAILRRIKPLRNLVRWVRRTPRKTVKEIELGLAHALLPASTGRRPARGSFSILESTAINEGGSPEGRIILRDQGHAEFPPESLMVRCGLRQHEEPPLPIFWSHHRVARLIGPGLSLLNQRGEIARECTYGGARVESDPCYRHVAWRRPVEISGRWTSVLSPWLPVDQPTNFCHWLLEALPRLAVIGEFPPDTGVLVPAQLQPFQLETLRWFGLENRLRPTREQHAIVEDYYFSAPPAMIVCYNPYAVNFLRERLLRHAKPATNGPRRIFLKRNGPVRNAVNEAELLGYFQKAGWTILDTAGLTLAEQMGIFNSAEAVCGIHGAGFTNVAWTQPGCHVIELCADNYLNGCFEWLAQCTGARHSFLVFPGNEDLSIHVDPGALHRHLTALGL